MGAQALLCLQLHNDCTSRSLLCCCVCPKVLHHTWNTIFLEAQAQQCWQCLSWAGWSSAHCQNPGAYILSGITEPGASWVLTDEHGGQSSHALCARSLFIL